MLGRLDDEDDLKQDYSRLLNCFSDPVSELSLTRLTYRGEFIDGDSKFNVGPKEIALNSIEGTKYNINPITPPPGGGKGSAVRPCVNVSTTDYRALIGRCHTSFVILGLRHNERV